MAEEEKKRIWLQIYCQRHFQDGLFNKSWTSLRKVRQLRSEQACHNREKDLSSTFSPQTTSGPPGSQAPRNSANSVAGSACYWPLIDMVFGATARHRSAAGRLQATALSKTFGETRVDLQLSEHVRRETELCNKKVNKDREILKRLTDGVIFFLFGQTGTFISGTRWKCWIPKQRKLCGASSSPFWEQHKHTWPEIARNTRGQARPSALASMAITKEFIMELKCTDNLYDRVTDLFLRKERKMDFVYK